MNEVNFLAAPGNVFLLCPSEEAEECCGIARPVTAVLRRRQRVLFCICTAVAIAVSPIYKTVAFWEPWESLQLTFDIMSAFICNLTNFLWFSKNF